MVAGLFVVQGVDHQVEAGEEGIPKAVFLDATFEVLDIDEWVLLTNGLFESFRLGHIYVLSSEEELPVEVGDIYGV